MHHDLQKLVENYDRICQHLISVPFQSIHKFAKIRHMPIDKLRMKILKVPPIKITPVDPKLTIVGSYNGLGKSGPCIQAPLTKNSTEVRTVSFASRPPATTITSEEPGIFMTSQALDQGRSFNPIFIIQMVPHHMPLLKGTL